MRVVKRTVEQFVIGTPVGDVELTKEEADALYEGLAEALGKPAFKWGKCGDRYSHGPHLDGDSFCRGRSFDAT